MNDEMMKKMLQQHIDNYRRGILDIIQNNTKVLIEDIVLFIGKPPLDSMDFILKKFLDIAKKEKIVLNTEKLNKMIDEFRRELLKSCQEIEKIRMEELTVKVEEFSFDNFEIFTFYKKDFIPIHRKMRAVLKSQILSSYENVIMKKIHTIFSHEVDNHLQDKMIQEVSKYMKDTYKKQILDNFDMKLLVKDTILMNGVKELSERYLYTKENSRLMNLE